MGRRVTYCWRKCRGISRCLGSGHLVQQAEASVSTRTCGPDPTTFDVCSVQPARGPDQVLSVWKLSNPSYSRLLRGVLNLSTGLEKCIGVRRSAPDHLQRYPDCVAGLFGRWGEGRKRKKSEDTGWEGWDPTKLGRKSTSWQQYRYCLWL